MIFFDYTKEINKDSDLYKFMNSTLQNLYKQLHLQKEKKNNLSILTDKLSDINVKSSEKINTSCLLEIISEIKNCLENIRNNIDDINNLIEQLKTFLNIIETNPQQAQEINLKLYYTLYIEKQNIILKKDLKTEKLFKKIFGFSNLFELDDTNTSNTVSNETIKDNIETSAINNSKKDKISETTDSLQTSQTSNIYSTTCSETPNTEEKVTFTKATTTEQQEAADSIVTTTEISDIKDNNVLLISETQNKVFLPFKVSDLELKLKENPKKYNSIQDLIDAEYVFSLSKYKNSSVARFKEAYSLMKNRENASFSKCLDLALELAFKYNLNPAVISACKNLDELDIYLDCLDDLALDDFKIFDIKYEVPPALK